MRATSQLIYVGMFLFSYFEPTKWYAKTFFVFSKKAFVNPTHSVINRGLIKGLKMVISFFAMQCDNFLDGGKNQEGNLFKNILQFSHLLTAMSGLSKNCGLGGPIWSFSKSVP